MSATGTVDEFVAGLRELIERMMPACSLTCAAIRAFTPTAAKMHEQRTDGYAAHRSAGLAECRKLLPLLKDMRAALDEQIATIEGTETTNQLARTHVH